MLILSPPRVGPLRLDISSLLRWWRGLSGATTYTHWSIFLDWWSCVGLAFITRVNHLSTRHSCACLWLLWARLAWILCDLGLWPAFAVRLRGLSTWTRSLVVELLVDCWLLVRLPRVRSIAWTWMLLGLHGIYSTCRGWSWAAQVAPKILSIFITLRPRPVLLCYHRCFFRKSLRCCRWCLASLRIRGLQQAASHTRRRLRPDD